MLKKNGFALAHKSNRSSPKTPPDQPHNQLHFSFSGLVRLSEIKYSQTFFIIKQFFIFLQPSN